MEQQPVAKQIKKNNGPRRRPKKSGEAKKANRNDQSDSGKKKSGVKDNNRRSRNKKNDKGKDFKVIQDDTTKQNNKVRDEQVSECEHLLNKSHGFKLFRKGDFINTYSFTFHDPSRTRSKDSNIRVRVQVPHDYPRNGLTLNIESKSRDTEVLQTICKNFKISSRNLTRQAVPIVSQLNMLVNSFDEYTVSNYAAFEDMKSQWFKSFEQRDQLEVVPALPKVDVSVA